MRAYLRGHDGCDHQILPKLTTVGCEGCDVLIKVCGLIYTVCNILEDIVLFAFVYSFFILGGMFLFLFKKKICTVHI
jgi:hypothetical protein